MTALERAARTAWQAWGDYAQHTSCDGCGGWLYCRARRRGKWLCLECFDQGLHDHGPQLLPESMKYRWAAVACAVAVEPCP